MTPFPADYFARPTLEVARDLVGARLVRVLPSGEHLVGRVVETEGYTQEDPAFHGWKLYDEATGQLKKKGRGIELFGPPGEGYVYLCYGVHWLLNVVTEPDGVGGAVLIRAIEPVEGLGAMRARRNVRRDRDLTNGPGKLTEALGIGGAFHGRKLTAPPLYFAAPETARDLVIATSSRIGITKGVDRPWRFFVEGHPYVSPGMPSDRK